MKQHVRSLGLTGCKGQGREGEMDQPEQRDRETKMLRERLTRLS